MAKQKKRWIYSPPKPSKPIISNDIKEELTQKSQQLIDTVLKPTYVKPPPEAPQFNYLTDIWTKWYRGYLYFCTTYACPGPSALSPSFEARFARMEYTGYGKFNLAYMRHTGQWAEIFTGLTVDECLDTIKNEPYFHP